MREQDLETAFTPFGQVKTRGRPKSQQMGTGLGLPLAKSLVEHHGGKLDLKSTPGKGMRVTLRFPSIRLVA